MGNCRKPARRRHALPTDEPLWGPRFTPAGVSFRVWAPDLLSLGLILNGSERPMRRDGDGWWQATAAARAGDDYSFRLEDGTLLADPAGAGGVWRPGWSIAALSSCRLRLGQPRLERMAWEEAVICEIHVGTFTEAGTFRAAIDRLAALAEAGFTAVEIMPVAQFAGSRGWGYDGVRRSRPIQPTAGRTTFGPSSTRRMSAGSVLLDVVYNHFGPPGFLLPHARLLRPDERRRGDWRSRSTSGGPAILLRECADLARRLRHGRAALRRGSRLSRHRLGRGNYCRDRAGNRARYVDRLVRLTTKETTTSRVCAPGRAGGRCCTRPSGTTTSTMFHCRGGGGPRASARLCERSMWLRAGAGRGFRLSGRGVAASGGMARGEAARACPPWPSLTSCRTMTRSATAPRASDRAGGACERGRCRRCRSCRPTRPSSSWARNGPRPALPVLQRLPGELGDAVRGGRRDEFRPFTSFANPAARRPYPRPDGPTTFQSARSTGMPGAPAGQTRFRSPGG